MKTASFLNQTWLLFFIIIAIPVNLMALSTDRDQPIELEADGADIDDGKGISTYTGNVILTQGSMRITAEKLTLYNNKNKDLEKAVAVGGNKLATFKQRPQGKKQDFKSRASTIVYYIVKEKVHLLKNAHVVQEGGSFSGNKIIYDTKKETIIASSKKDKKGKISSGGRVKVTIPSKNK